MTNPEHAAVRSKATALLAPRRFCTAQALPNASSGEDVASRTRSRSAAATPEDCSAASAAATQ